MGNKDKIKNTAEAARGNAKETTGKVAGKPGLTVKGKAEQIKADTAQAAQKVKDAAKH